MQVSDFYKFSFMPVYDSKEKSKCWLNLIQKCSFVGLKYTVRVNYSVECERKKWLFITLCLVRSVPIPLLMTSMTTKLCNVMCHYILHRSIITISVLHTVPIRAKIKLCLTSYRLVYAVYSLCLKLANAVVHCNEFSRLVVLRKVF